MFFMDFPPYPPEEEEASQPAPVKMDDFEPLCVLGQGTAYFLLTEYFVLHNSY
jgi:hypothetical protein